jgi:hypothetical protein
MRVVVLLMRNYPATLLRVFENKLDAGHDTDDAEIPFGKEDLTRATEELDINVRDVMEIASAYASHRDLPDEIADHDYTLERDTDYDGPGEQYMFVKE